MPRIYSIPLTDEERAFLRKLTEEREKRRRVADRARVLLMKNEGAAVDTIASTVGLSRDSVLLCLKKFRTGGVKSALSIAPGRGRKPKYTPEERDWIISEARKDPRECGCDGDSWTYSRLTAHINRDAAAAGHERLSGISYMSVMRIVNAAGVRFGVKNRS